jgi:pimeloyl-ACP methyl ester carboxylesterase
MEAVMSLVQLFRKCRKGEWNRVALLTAAAAWMLAVVMPVRAHVVPLADMLRGIRMTPAQCAALPSTLWLTVSGRSFCIRYYLSTAGGEGLRPVVFLQGDRFGRLNIRTGAFSPGLNDKDLDTDNFVRFAEKLSRATKTTAIYLARVGVDGSSGRHSIRHSVLELNVTNAALDALKRRHGFAGFHLIGQSGGSLLSGGLLAKRDDIGCAVIGSGPLALLKPPRHSPDPGRDYFNVADTTPAIAQRRATRILVVTDPADKKVPERSQTGFVWKLRQAGGRAEQFLVQATDNDHHGVVVYAVTAAIGCLRGKSNEVIAKVIQRQVEKRLAAKAKSGAKLEPRRGALNAGAPAVPGQRSMQNRPMSAAPLGRQRINNAQTRG